METYDVCEEPGFSEDGYVGYKFRIEPGAPAIHPYQLALDWRATGHHDIPWMFAVRPSRPPVYAVAATRLAWCLGAMARAAWWVAVTAAQRVAYLAERRAARLGRPMRPMLVPDYRSRVRRRYAFLVYAIVITGLIVWPNFLLAYQDVAAHVHAAALRLTHHAP